MEDIVALFIPMTFVIVTGLVTKWLSDNRVRRELANSNPSPEFVEKLMASPLENADSSLKWGMVSVAIGASLVCIQLLGIDAEDPVTFGLVFIFGGAALLLFYYIKSQSGK